MGESLYKIIDNLDAPKVCVKNPADLMKEEQQFFMNIKQFLENM